MNGIQTINERINASLQGAVERIEHPSPALKWVELRPRNVSETFKNVVARYLDGGFDLKHYSAVEEVWGYAPESPRSQDAVAVLNSTRGVNFHVRIVEGPTEVSGMVEHGLSGRSFSFGLQDTTPEEIAQRVILAF